MKFRIFAPHALNQWSSTEGKGQKLTEAARLEQNDRSSQKQHALKGQKLLAQGNALGIKAVSKAPCKGKSFTNCRGILKLLPLQGDKFANIITQGVALG